MNEKATVTDSKVTTRKFDEKEASVNNKKDVADKRTRRTRGYPDGGPWVRQHEAELFQT